MKKTVYTTTTAVTALSVAERGLGFLYRIVLSRLIGAEGLGLYQVALSLFSLFLTIGTGGIPITVSRMISKSKAERRPMDEVSAFSSGAFLSLLLTLLGRTRPPRLSDSPSRTLFFLSLRRRSRQFLGQ